MKIPANGAYGCPLLIMANKATASRPERLRIKSQPSSVELCFFIAPPLSFLF